MEQLETPTAEQVRLCSEVAEAKVKHTALTAELVQLESRAAAANAQLAAAARQHVEGDAQYSRTARELEREVAALRKTSVAIKQEEDETKAELVKLHRATANAHREHDAAQEKLLRTQVRVYARRILTPVSFTSQAGRLFGG